MKAFLFIALLYCLPACRPEPLSPIILNPPTELPPITYVGANTFGCEIDGKVFVAFSDNLNQPTNSYLLPEFFSVSGLLSLQTNGRYVHENVRVYIPATEWHENDTMTILGSSNLYPASPDTSSGSYIDDPSGGDYYYTSPTSGGELKILYWNSIDRTITGVFWFNAIHTATGDTVRIRNGRFDVKY
jgi:hypothetical protein